MCCEVFKFWVNSCDGLWNKEWQEPKIGDAHGTPNIIQGHQKVKAWGCPGRHPLFRPLPSVIYLELYFYSPTWYVFCLERLVLFGSLFVSMPQSSLLYTPFERAIHELKFDRILYVLHLYLLSIIIFLYVLHLYLFELSSFALCASLISFERYNFALCASLRYFRARWWICFKETIDLSCFT